MFTFGKNISQLFSYIFQPLLMPLYSVVLLFLYTNFFIIYSGQILAFLYPIFLLTIVIPVAFIFVLKTFRYIKSFNLTFSSERIMPLFVYIVANISLVYFFYNSRLPYWFLGLVAVPASIALFALVITFFWKVSIHMMAIGGLVGSVISICYHIVGVNPIGLLIVLFTASGILGVSRLYLRASTASQVYVGYVIGFIVSYCTIFGMLLFDYF